MRVKRLEIQGFKSFKDKTVVHFDDGVTGIVGPNGCGKSNIVDAFFWVMGEQSYKHMRAGGQMDLIFSGSEKYSPLSMAEVTLILDTGVKKSALVDASDARDLPAHLRYEEISVTRRVFRDGESEFAINGQTCRLRDIQELFMDTGAGPKAYSIVEQGQISRIVASKADDRRVIIEEAAGISKFKARKKESLRKIEATRQNLNRINDIIAEIERQLRSLERQAARARKFKEYKDALKGKETFLGRKKLNDLQLQLDKAHKRAEEIDVTDVENHSLLQTTELRIENLKIEVTEAQKTTEEAQDRLQLLQREISQEDTKIQLKKRQIEELDNTSLTLDEELVQLKNSLTRLTEEKELLEIECQELEEKHQNADEVLRDQQEKLDAAKAIATELEQTVEAEKRDLMSSLSRKSEISNQVHGLEARVDALSVQINGLLTKITARENECEVLEEKLSQVKQEFESSSSRAQRARTVHTELKALVENLESDRTRLRHEESEAREEKVKTETRLKAIQQLVESHEGLQGDVKNILKESEFSDALKGVFADLVQANTGYEFSLEAVLRDFLGDIFVDQGADAKQLIQKLKEKSLGRASFWPIDLLQQSASHSRELSDSDLAQVMSVLPNAIPLKNVIQVTHDRADDLIKLFQRIFVVDSLDQALSAFVQCAPLEVSFVTRDGDILDHRGRVLGGSTKALESGILARKAELQKLSEQLETLTFRSVELKTLLTNVETTLETKKVELDSASAELSESDVAAKSAERDLASTQSQLTIAKEELARLKTEHETLDQERKVHWAKLDEIRHELSGMEDSTKEREQLIEAKAEELDVAEKNANELQGALVQLKVEFTSARERLSHGKENLTRIDGELVTKRARREEVETLINRKLDEKDFHGQELEVLEQHYKEMLSTSAEQQSALDTKKDELERLNQGLSGSYQKLNQMRQLLDSAGRELNDIRVNQEKWRLEFQMISQTLFEKYGIQEEGFKPQNEEEQQAFDALDEASKKELQQEVDQLHDKIRKLGEVNVMAMEEYDEQKQRHEFLVSQREDLLKSIEDLERAIQRINKTSIERFKIAFDEVNMRFQRIFPIIFGGGWGKLVMTNSDDLSETGVDIIAEPPGKKVGSIQLMSGGEKALTAVSLIFSIFLIKPSPFCVLDEVDAPLDDSNVGKFNTLLKEMAIRSQFIIITHNKRTMELNDKLYGVTMEEPGVSKMVSIQLQ